MLRTYEEHQGRINNLCFASNNKNFLSVANETSIRLWDIQDSQTNSVASIQAAHSDHIKKVAYLPDSEDYFLSASSDKSVKLWDLRNTKTAINSFSTAFSIEDFCFLPEGQLLVANGANLTLMQLSTEGLKHL